MPNASQLVDTTHSDGFSNVRLAANEERSQCRIMRILCKVPENIRRFITVQDSGCWLWTGTLFTTGYGAFTYGGKLWKAHRLVWTFINGPIPPRIHCLHHCDSPPCVNAFDTEHHLFLGTNRDNHQDKAAKGRHWQQKKTHCPQGHPYSPENTYRTNEGGRQCCICKGIPPRKVVA